MSNIERAVAAAACILDLLKRGELTEAAVDDALGKFDSVTLLLPSMAEISRLLNDVRTLSGSVSSIFVYIDDLDEDFSLLVEDLVNGGLLERTKADAALAAAGVTV